MSMHYILNNLMSFPEMQTLLSITLNVIIEKFNRNLIRFKKCRNLISPFLLIFYAQGDPKVTDDINII